MQQLCEIIEVMKKQAKENFVPIVREDTLQFLKQTAQECDAKNILEIGTATGYSGLNMLSCTKAQLTTLEKNEERFAAAKENFKKAGVEERVESLLGDAQTLLEELAMNDRKFDFVFLDGPKGQYMRYFPLIKRLLTGGGVLFADNVGVLGMVGHLETVTHKNRTMVRNMQTFLDTIMADDEFKTQIYNIDDGFLIAKKKEN